MQIFSLVKALLKATLVIYLSCTCSTRTTLKTNTKYSTYTKYISYIFYPIWISCLLKFFRFEISNSEIENILNGDEEINYSSNKFTGEVMPIPLLRKTDNNLKDKPSSLGPNDHIWTNIALNLTILLRSFRGENPNILLNFSTVPTMIAVPAS